MKETLTIGAPITETITVETTKGRVKIEIGKVSQRRAYLTRDEVLFLCDALRRAREAMT